MMPITTNSETVPGKDPSCVPEKAKSFIFSSEDPILLTGLRDLSVLEWSRVYWIVAAVRKCSGTDSWLGNSADYTDYG
jgi:hypothetical protein